MNGRDAQIVNNRINNIIEETNKEESNVEDEIPVLSFDEIKEVSYFDTIIKKIEQKLRTLDSQPSDKQDALRSMIPIIDYWNQSSLYEKGRLMKDLKILSIPEIYTYITNGKYNDKQDQIIR